MQKGYRERTRTEIVIDAGGADQEIKSRRVSACRSDGAPSTSSSEDVEAGDTPSPEHVARACRINNESGKGSISRAERHSGHFEGRK